MTIDGNEAMKPRPIRNCGQMGAHDGHHYLDERRAPSVYTRCEGVRKGAEPFDPAATRTDIPVQPEPLTLSDIGRGLSKIGRDFMNRLLDIEEPQASAVRVPLVLHAPPGISREDLLDRQVNLAYHSGKVYDIRVPEEFAAFQKAVAPRADWTDRPAENKTNPVPADSDLAHILYELFPEIEAHMRRSGAHYGYEAHTDLGLRGQYSDMYRKWVVLKRVMWDGEETTREPLREILMDLIGHSLLTIAMLDREAQEAVRAEKSKQG